MLATPVAAMPPPAIVAPAPREASFGRVSGTVPDGTRRVIVRVGERVLADRRVGGRRYSLGLDLPRGIIRIRVTAVDGSGHRSSSTVGPVLGLPAAAAPRAVAARNDPALAGRVRALVRGFPATAAVYVQDLTSGRGAAWNAAARFPAASTLKLAIAVTALRMTSGKPGPGSRAEVLLERMLLDSDNAAANELEAFSGGAATVDRTLAALGLRDSLMFGGYELDDVRLPAATAPIPVRVERAPSFRLGKYTSAADLAGLARVVHLAAGGRGPLPDLGVSPSEARYLLWLLARVRDHGKLDRYLGASASVLHKGGWLATARHDNGLIYWGGGVFVATVLTWSPGGVGSSSDVLAGRVAATASERFRRVG